MIVDAGSISGNTFSIHVTSQMAPNTIIIVYFVRADGEVVTDSISFDVEGVFKNKVRVFIAYFNSLHAKLAFLRHEELVMRLF